MAKNVHVVKSGTRWAVKVEGCKEPVSKHSTQKLAQKNAIPIAKKNHSEVVIHGKDGKIRDKDSYGNDPHPPKDTKM